MEGNNGVKTKRLFTVRGEITMIIYHEGSSIFDTKAKILVNPVNCLGVAGKGLAKEFKERYPRNHGYYRMCCFDDILNDIGDVVFFEDKDGILIANFATKRHWKNPSDLDKVAKGLAKMYRIKTSWGLVKDFGRMAMPRLGCGLGGLDWLNVKSAIEHTFRDYKGILEVWSLK